jgi:hypothetical protein
VIFFNEPAFTNVVAKTVEIGAKLLIHFNFLIITDNAQVEKDSFENP